MKSGNEIRLVSGSVNDIINAFNDLKKRNKTEYVTLYTLDNGTFNRGLRTFDKKITTKDLRLYDNKNSGGGHFMYLMN